MAWRLSRYQTFIPNVTTITAAFLNAVQDAIVDIFNGNFSLKNLLIDGTGDVAASYLAGVVAKIAGGALQVEGASGDTGQSLSMETSPTNRKHIARFKCSGGAGGGPIYAHLYAEGTSGGFTIVVNANWNGTNWVYDDSSTVIAFGVRFSIGGNLLQFLFSNGSNTFSDATFQSRGTSAAVSAALVTFNDAVTVVGNLTGAILKATSNISSATAGAGQGVPIGSIYRDTTPVAWGRLHVSGGAVSLVRGANISAVSYVVAGHYTVTLQNAVGHNLCVMLSSAKGNTTRIVGWDSTGDNSQFDVYVWDTTNALAEALSDVSFVVFGG